MTPGQSLGLRPRTGELRTLWQYRWALRELTIRNIKVKYQGSFLGFLWTLANPICVALILVMVFTLIVRVPLERYWAFLVSGYFVWNFTAQVLTAGTYTLAEHAHISRSVALPPEIVLLSTVLSRLIEFVCELGLAALVLVVAHHGDVPTSLAWLPLLLVLQTALALGLQLPLATLSVFFRDVQHALQVALMALFYATPIIYPLEMVPDELRPFFVLNPLVPLITAYHDVLYWGRAPDPGDLLLLTVIALGVLAFGYLVFRRYKAFFAEIV